MSKTQDSIGLTEEGLKKIQQRMSELEKPFDPDNKQGWSQEDLAQGSRTSVSTVKRFLNRKPITRQRIIKLTAALGIAPEEVVDLKVWNRTTATSQSTRKSDIDWQDVCFTMLEPKREIASNLFTSGMGIKFKLDDIHVPLGLVERPQKAQGRDDSSPEEGSRVYREEKEKITPIDYDDFFQQVLANQQSPKSNGKRLNIIGEPGAGKTTQLLKIADWVLDETEGLPIWISLGVVGEKPLQEYLLKDWLRDAAGKLDAAPPEWVEQLEQYLKDGRVWLLLDGADEMQVADPLGKLAEFVRVPLLKNVRVVLTCRLNLWDAAGNALSEFDTYKLLDFSYGDGKNSDQVKQFIDKWFGNPSPALPYKEREQEASPRVGGTEGGQQLRKALDETGKERIKDLARHPLRLALLCFTWQSGRGKLPDTKAELYEMFVEALYVLKKGVFPTTSAQQRDLNAALGRLALKAIDKGFKSILPHSLVNEELEKPHPELFELADKLGWLNKVGVEPENPLKPVYAFFHPTFQEYFAACAIPDWDFFLPHGHEARPVRDKDNPEKYNRYRVFEPQWKEVILLWLGRKKVERKEEFIQALIEFKDGCWDVYWYRAVFLAAASIAEFKDCIYGNWIVATLVEWSLDTEIWDWRTVFNPIIAEGARAALLETDRDRVINILIYLLQNHLDFLDNDARWKAFNILEKIGIGNPEVIAALTKLMDTRLDDKELPIEAAFFLGKINPDKGEANEFLKQQLWNTSLPDWLRLQATSFLGKIDQRNQEAIDFLTKLINQNQSLRLDAASTLGEIDPGNQLAIKTLRKLLNTERGDRVMNIPLIAACNLLETNPENPDAIRVLRELVKPGQAFWERLQAASALGKTQQYKQEAIKVICELISKTLKTGKNRQLLQRAIESLKQLDSSFFYSFPSCKQEDLSRKKLYLI